jgi:hypothetical protein
MNSFIASVRACAAAATLAGFIVITTPSGQSAIKFTDGAASHVTSNYSAQINDTFAGPGQHVTATAAGTKVVQSSGQTATITVVSE